MAKEADTVIVDLHDATCSRESSSILIGRLFLHHLGHAENFMVSTVQLLQVLAES
jgi:hypothetical protein